MASAVFLTTLPLIIKCGLAEKKKKRRTRFLEKKKKNQMWEYKSCLSSFNQQLRVNRGRREDKCVSSSRKRRSGNDHAWLLFPSSISITTSRPCWTPPRGRVASFREQRGREMPDCEPTHSSPRPSATKIPPTVGRQTRGKSLAPLGFNLYTGPKQTSDE